MMKVARLAAESETVWQNPKTLRRARKASETVWQNPAEPETARQSLKEPGRARK